MNVEYIGNKLNQQQKDQIFNVLCECDNEFYPPLSARSGSAQQELIFDNSGSNFRPYVYFEEMINQEFIIVRHADAVVGFMSFKKNYTCSALQNYDASLYITTVCVKLQYRHQGILGKMYDEIENNVSKLLNCPYISTRTWSLNEAQIHSLGKRGYEKAAVLRNDRGNGIDTIYYINRVNLN